MEQFYCLILFSRNKQWSTTEKYPQETNRSCHYE